MFSLKHLCVNKLVVGFSISSANIKALIEVRSKTMSKKLVGNGFYFIPIVNFIFKKKILHFS